MRAFTVDLAAAMEENRVEREMKTQKVLTDLYKKHGHAFLGECGHSVCKYGTPSSKTITEQSGELTCSQ